MMQPHVPLADTGAAVALVEWAALVLLPVVRDGAALCDIFSAGGAVVELVKIGPVSGGASDLGDSILTAASVERLLRACADRTRSAPKSRTIRKTTSEPRARCTRSKRPAGGVKTSSMSHSVSSGSGSRSRRRSRG